MTVFNRGLRPLTLTGVSAAGPFQVEMVSPLRVPAGASASIPVTFRPTRAGQAADSLVLMTDDPDRPRASVALSGRGRGIPVARLSASDLDFGGAPVGSAQSVRLTLSNDGDDDLNVARLSVPEPFRVASDPFALPAGQSREIEVRFVSDRRGDVAETLTLTVDDPARPTLTVPLKGRGTAPRTRLSATTLDFGEVGMEKASRLPVILFNDGDADLVVSQVVSEHPMFAVSDGALTVPPGASAMLTVTYSPYWLVPVTGRILLKTNDPGHLQIDLGVSGTGVPRRPQVRLVLVPSTDGGGRVAVYVEDVPALTGYAVTLRFDPALLRFEGASVRPGGETGLLGADILEAPPLVQDGVVTFGGARFPSAGAVREGKGLLGVVTFRPTEGLTAGRETPLKVERVFLRGPEGNAEGKGICAGISMPMAGLIWRTSSP
ncbi:MAG: choice-of-anchor D domain-containing protein [Candidatus Latescibacteria bacterium]|nr:choice-of-anchor D domain-containing protein [Candidatus Latescibacterota bacterium]